VGEPGSAPERRCGVRLETIGVGLFVGMILWLVFEAFESRQK
jgi:hypothetical protein